MDAVIHIITLGHFPGQAHLHGFKAIAFAVGAAHLTVFFPLGFPADVLDVGAVFDAAVISRAVEFDVHPFQTVAETAGAGALPVNHIGLPTDIFHMGAVGNAVVGMDVLFSLNDISAVVIGCGIKTRRRFSFFHQDNLHAFQAIAEAGGSRFLAVFGPGKPAEILRVDPIINVIIVSELPGQAHLHGLKTIAFAVGAADGVIRFPILFPADILHMGAVFDVAGKSRIVKLDGHGLKAVGQAGGAGHLSVSDIRLPADVLHMGAVINRRNKFRGIGNGECSDHQPGRRVVGLIGRRVDADGVRSDVNRSRDDLSRRVGDDDVGHIAGGGVSLVNRDVDSPSGVSRFLGAHPIQIRGGINGILFDPGQGFVKLDNTVTESVIPASGAEVFGGGFDDLFHLRRAQIGGCREEHRGFPGDDRRGKGRAADAVISRRAEGAAVGVGAAHVLTRRRNVHRDIGRGTAVLVNRRRR